MKFSQLTPLAAAIVALGAPLVSVAQTTATTAPVGFLTVSVPAGSSSAWSLPLYNTPVFQSSISSVDSSTSFSLTSASFTAGQYASSPFFVHVQTGNSAGKFYLISSNTTTQLTVATNGADLTTLLAMGDQCEIIAGNTLASVFGATAPGLQTGATFDVADNVFLWNGKSWDTYFNNGTNWKKTGSLGNQNPTIIYPDEGIFISRRNTSTGVSVTVMGTVPTTKEQTDLAAHDSNGHGSTFIANRFPVDMQLSAIGLQNTANWKSGATFDVADNVFAWNGHAWDTYFYNGTNWKKTGSLGIQDTTVIPAGTALFVTRSSASGATLSQNLPYTP